MLLTASIEREYVCPSITRPLAHHDLLYATHPSSCQIDMAAMTVTRISVIYTNKNPFLCLFIWNLARLHLPDLIGVLLDGAVTAELARACCRQNAHLGPFLFVLVRLINLPKSSVAYIHLH